MTRSGTRPCTPGWRAAQPHPRPACTSRRTCWSRSRRRACALHTHNPSRGAGHLPAREVRGAGEAQAPLGVVRGGRGGSARGERWRALRAAASIAVGTTSVRVLEQAALLSQDDGVGALSPVSGWADLFILPGHRFRLVDGMVTNFHLPRSTLLMLVSAFAGADAEPDSGRRLMLSAYREAIGLRYRLFSFGDCMLIL